MKVGAGGEMEEKWIIYLPTLRQLFVVHRFIWQFLAALEKTPLSLPGLPVSFLRRLFPFQP